MKRPRITTAEELAVWIVRESGWYGCTCYSCKPILRAVVREVESFVARKTARKQVPR